MNIIILSGRLTKDIELRYAGETAVCNFNLAVKRDFAKTGEERQSDFFSIVIWSKLAEIVSKNCIKGQMITIMGRLQARSYETDGVTKYITEVVAEKVDFGAKPKDSNEESY